MIKRTAFTMIELVFVIIIIGILATFALPRLERDLKQEAGDSILSAIRYTQHLSLMDNKTNPLNVTWQRSLWQIRFSNIGGEWLYSIASNIDLNSNLDKDESATDPTNGKYLYSADASPADSDESPEIFLTEKYGINNVVFNGCKGSLDSAAKHIAFDHLGRPHRGVTQGGTNDYGTLVSNENCQITFLFGSNDTNMSIIIERETGYAYIVGYNAS